MILEEDKALESEYLEEDSSSNFIEEEEEIDDTPIKLDYQLKTPQERNELVKKIIEKTPYKKLTPRYLEILSDYIIFAIDKQERKERYILTDNRLVTVNKRETSFQGLVSKFENGEDGIYNLIANDKNIIFQPKDEITEEDVRKIPALAALREAIKKVEEECKKATGKRKYLLKKQLIKMRQDQYVIRNSYRQTIYIQNPIKSFTYLNLNENIVLDENNEPVSDCIISFFEPKHISAILCNYSKLKADAWGKFKEDSCYALADLDKICESALKNFPLYEDIVLYKIDGRQNVEIQELLNEKYGIKHSVEYISSLWRNKIPKLIAEKAKEEYILWYYTYKEKGKWKKCSRCGQIKLAHNRFFSKNKTSKDGYYSICKKCRNKKIK